MGEIAYTGASSGKGRKIYIVVKELSKCEDEEKNKKMAEEIKEKCAGKTTAQIREILKDVKGIEKLPEAEMEALVADLADTVGLSGARTEIYKNLREETQRKLEELLKIANDPKNKTLSKAKLRPAFSTSYNVITGKYYYARNLTKEEVAKEEIIYHPYVKERTLNMDKEIYESYKDMTIAPGSHAECLSLNESMLDQFCMENNIERSALTQELIDKVYKESPNSFNQKPSDTVINVVNSYPLNKVDLEKAGRPMPRCPHCKHITLNSDVLDEVLQAEREMYSKRFPLLKFDK
ncbi:YwqJ-related putative deaminase [Pseudobacteroides cellulosolvens]|uniref:YwqJ-like deaminase n=1 Tax=Pseudobacteroides cellulosolvens ATCC 35603 = DSM 2933 TaxID=398512 RepID=A0A0L6JVB7_9FIRM|nr:YwqJ-related putative deaminase [Pseudobacteroides cellulosolvens]KNY29372.1 YwqJ-like deaminase [Pseudobacteroides cellulosolvens ATCC 35603 = DSM 2933]